MLGTRFSVKWKDQGDTDNFHGRALLAPRKSNWISPNHHGRLSTPLTKLLHENMTTSWPKKPAMVQKPYITLCTQFDPSLYPYGSENVTNGFSRSNDFPNLWISDGNSFPQELTLSFSKACSFQSIHLTFDTCLDSDDRMYGFPKSDFCFTYPVPECIRDYSILAHIANASKDGNWIELFSIKGNTRRQRRHYLDSPIIADKISIKVISTNGDPTARIFEVRMY